MFVPVMQAAAFPDSTGINTKKVHVFFKVVRLLCIIFGTYKTWMSCEFGNPEKFLYSPITQIFIHKVWCQCICRKTFQWCTFLLDVYGSTELLFDLRSYDNLVEKMSL